MKLKFDHTHYVPVLRWKRAERDALVRLTNDVRKRMTPLLELVLTKSNSPSKIADSIRKYWWGPSPFFLDDMNWPEAETGKIITTMADAMRFHGLLVIPVTGLDRSKKHQSAVARIAAKDLRGACLRICPSDLQSLSLDENLDGLLKLLALAPEQVDLVADYQIVSEFNMPYTVLCDRVPYLSRWRTFTVIGGAFPENLVKYDKNGEYHRPREDWSSWQSQVTASSLRRRPTYGDYTIQYGVFKPPPERAHVSASIRYTAPEYWVIMRGEWLGNPDGTGYAQYAAHAKLLYEKEEFSGNNFSYGDTYIDRLRSRLDGTGSAETLLRAGINHHITLVVNQIANLFGTSTGGGPFRGSQPNLRLRQGVSKSMPAAYASDSSLGRARPVR